MKKVTLAVLAAALAAMSVGLWSCNHGRPCFRMSRNLTTEPYGPTDINAITGNRGLSIGFNKEGTITVFKWPNPSFYDQVKFMTGTRDQERMGALENEGVMTGVHYEADGRRGFFWLRDAVVGSAT